MRRVLTALAALTIAAAVAPMAQAQVSSRDRNESADGTLATPTERRTRIAPLSRRANAGPCPYVKILYDAARYVELTGDRVAASNVGYTGEIEGVSSDCRYREDDPIAVDLNILFSLGRGPQASGDQRSYRYWIAVTERNKAVLAKQYFDIPANFGGQTTTSVQEERSIVIPRASIDTSGGNFEILVGFDITPEMAEFNRTGSRFRVNAGTTQAAPAAAPAPSE